MKNFQFSEWTKIQLVLTKTPVFSSAFALLAYLDIDARTLKFKIQGESNCLYVSQYVSWLTSLLKLGQYRQIVRKLSQF